MSILDEQLKNDKLASAYIFEGKNPSSNKEFALDFAKNVFSSYKVASDIENNPDLYVLDKEGDVIDIQYHLGLIFFLLRLIHLSYLIRPDLQIQLIFHSYIPLYHIKRFFIYKF